MLKIPPKPGFFDVGMHGNPTGVGFGIPSEKAANMTARQLAAVIRHMGHYKGQKVRLLSCSTGGPVKQGINFAQQLANALGVEVEAPTETLYANKNGDTLITSNELFAWFWFQGSQMVGTGDWKSFNPGGR